MSNNLNTNTHLTDAIIKEQIISIQAHIDEIVNERNSITKQENEDSQFSKEVRLVEEMENLRISCMIANQKQREEFLAHQQEIDIAREEERKVQVEKYLAEIAPADIHEKDPSNIEATIDSINIEISNLEISREALQETLSILETQEKSIINLFNESESSEKTAITDGLEGIIGITEQTLKEMIAEMVETKYAMLEAWSKNPRSTDSSASAEHVATVHDTMEQILLESLALAAYDQLPADEKTKLSRNEKIEAFIEKNSGIKEKIKSIIQDPNTKTDTATNYHELTETKKDVKNTKADLKLTNEKIEALNTTINGLMNNLSPSNKPTHP